MAKSHQDKQRDFAAKELQARVTAYDGELAKMAEEQKELEVECATANENMSRAMKWSVNIKKCDGFKNCRGAMFSILFIFYQKGFRNTKQKNQLFWILLKNVKMNCINRLRD